MAVQIDLGIINVKKTVNIVNSYNNKYHINHSNTIGYSSVLYSMSSKIKDLKS